MIPLFPDVPPQLIEFLARHAVDHEFSVPGVPMPTVSLAAQAIGVEEAQILKTLVFAAPNGEFVVAVANGNERIDRKRLAEVAGVAKLRPASPADVLVATGYEAGGVSPLGLPPGTKVVVDSATARLGEAFGGGGREDVLLRIRVADIVRLNAATVADIQAHVDTLPS